MTLTFRTKVKTGFTIDSDWSAFTFPAGEAHVKSFGEHNPENIEYQLADLRGADSHELFQLAMWADACYSRGDATVLLLPYLPGARADRGEPSGASVYAAFINDMVIDQVITLDPHSPYMPSKLDGLTVYPFERIIKRELGDRGYNPYVGVIAPDKGAIDRAQRAADVLGVPLFKAEKTRDFETGKLTGFTCESLPAGGRLLIVDDICDGGGTFIGLADQIYKTQPHVGEIDLWVTHGVFSKGFAELDAYIGNIYTTDSFPFELPPIWAQFVKVIPVLPYLTGEINV